jgi:sialic acid synthase
MQIGTKHIGNGRPCYVIAEIGQNHQGDPYHAVRLIQMSAACGVDAVKLQARDCEKEFTQHRLDQPYNGRNSFGNTYREHRQKLDLQHDDFRLLKSRHKYNKNPAELFCTVCAITRLEELERDNWCKFYKIASKDMNNRELLKAVSATKKPVIISTGMSRTDKDIDNAYNLASKSAPVALMYCVSEYPTPIESVVLQRIDAMRARYGCPIGYSDHTAGVKVPAIAAIKHAADLVEVHVTKNRAQPGTDHAASLEEPGLRQLVEWIRTSETVG